jgi:hypothetical protein
MKKIIAGLVLLLASFGAGAQTQTATVNGYKVTIGLSNCSQRLVLEYIDQIRTMVPEMAKAKFRAGKVDGPEIKGLDMCWTTLGDTHVFVIDAAGGMGAIEKEKFAATKKK